jgi:hypothetical protein
MIATQMNVKTGLETVRPFSAVSATPKDSVSLMSLKLKGVLQVVEEKRKVSTHKLNGIEEIQHSS